MEQKYRMLEVGEMLVEGDEYYPHWKKVKNLYPAEFMGWYRRPTLAEEIPAASWFDQRAELADAKNQITDLTRRLEDALSDKVIAEKDLFAYAEFTRNIAAELGLGTFEISFKEVIASVKQLYQDSGNLATTLMKANSKNHGLKINLDNAMSSMMSDEAQIADQTATIRRLREKLENVEPYLTTHTSAERIAQLEKRITDLHKEAERLSMENEELYAARYQLNTIKQAFEFLSRG